MDIKNVKPACWIPALLLTILLLAYTNVEAKPFPAKTITFVVPVAPGGGFDTFTRLIVPFLQKYLPGNPDIVVQNIPGGEWNIGISKPQTIPNTRKSRLPQRARLAPCSRRS